jgi:gliding motility-associated-like protein
MVMIGIYYQTNSCNICIPQTVQTFDVETNETQACPGGLASATATPNGGTAPYSYTWQPSAQTGQTANNLPPGTYVVFVTDSGGCASGTDSVSIVNSPAPNAQFILSPSPVANFPGQVCMTDVTSGAASWVWTVDNTTQFTSSSACYTLLDTGTICIELIVTDTNGCLDTAESCVTAISEGMITTPNVFTPNADGVNDVFAPTFTGMRSMSCVIYNRWGSEVYEWEGLNGSWNGKTGSGQDVADGVYYYVFTAIDLQDKKITQQGFVQLIREK